MNTKCLCTVALASLAGVIHAQSISSFNFAQISGVTVNRTGNQIALNVSPTATLTYNAVTYNVTEVFGVWALDDNNDMGGTGTNQNGWTFDSGNGIRGWKTNPNNGILGSSLTFNYSTLTGTVEDFGYHIRVSGNLPGGGNTAYFRPDAVPEPASMTALALGLAAALKRRRR